MRVLHISEVSWGGVVSILNEVITEQACRGYEVNLVRESGPLHTQIRRSTTRTTDTRSFVSQVRSHTGSPRMQRA